MSSSPEEIEVILTDVRRVEGRGAFDPRWMPSCAMRSSCVAGVFAGRYGDFRDSWEVTHAEAGVGRWVPPRRPRT